MSASVPPMAAATSQGSKPSAEARASLLQPAETLLAASALLLLYVLPLWILAWEIWRTGGENPSPYFAWIDSLASNSGSALTEVHQLLLPLVSGLSVVALRTPTRGARWLAGFVLLNFVFAIGLDVALNIDDVAKGLEGLDVEVELLVGLSRRVRETLLLYYAILVGVRLGSPYTSPSAPPSR